nr:extracellular solute-binding protein [Enterococcus cecorum]
MKFMKKSLITLTVLGAALGLAACGNKEEKTAKQDSKDVKEITVTTWNYDTTPEFKALFDGFEKKTGIKVKNIDIASDDYDTKLTTMLSSGDTTDVLTMKNLLSYSNYAYRNQLVDVTDHIKKIDTDPAKDAYKMFDIEGKTYAQPYRTDFWVLYYNKDLFKEAGIADPENLTWDQYEEIANKLTKKDGVHYGAYQHTWRSTIQAIAQAQNGENLLKPKYDYLEDYYTRAVRMQKDQAQMDFGTAKSTKVTYQSQFEEEKTAMMYMGTWYMAGVLSNKEAGKTNVNWAIAPIPQLKADGKVTTFGSPTAFAINKNSKKQKAAQEFIDFATGKEGAEILAKVGVVPAYRTQEISDLYFSKEGMPTDDISKNAFNPDKIEIEFATDKNAPAIDKILQEEHDLIMTGDESPAKGIANMESRVKNEIE